jgi:hypothetical protein
MGGHCHASLMGYSEDGACLDYDEESHDLDREQGDAHAGDVQAALEHELRARDSERKAAIAHGLMAVLDTDPAHETPQGSTSQLEEATPATSQDGLEDLADHIAPTIKVVMGYAPPRALVVEALGKYLEGGEAARKISDAMLGDKAAFRNIKMCYENTHPARQISIQLQGGTGIRSPTRLRGRVNRLTPLSPAGDMKSWVHELVSTTETVHAFAVLFNAKQKTAALVVAIWNDTHTALSAYNCPLSEEDPEHELILVPEGIHPDREGHEVAQHALLESIADSFDVVQTSEAIFYSTTCTQSDSRGPTDPKTKRKNTASTPGSGFMREARVGSAYRKWRHENGGKSMGRGADNDNSTRSATRASVTAAAASLAATVSTPRPYATTMAEGRLK